MLLFYIKSQLLLWQVDLIYDFPPSLLNHKRGTYGNLIFCVEKFDSLFRDKVVKIIWTEKFYLFYKLSKRFQVI